MQESIDRQVDTLRGCLISTISQFRESDGADAKLAGLMALGGVYDAFDSAHEVADGVGVEHESGHLRMGP